VSFFDFEFSEKVDSPELGQEFADFFFQVLKGVLVSAPAGAVEQEQARDVSHPEPFHEFTLPGVILEVLWPGNSFALVVAIETGA
jgi:hypothetical protein